MDSAKLNDWMQVVGIFAVVASLIFVGLQMKQSQEIAIAAQYQERANAANDLLLAFLENPNAERGSRLLEAAIREEWPTNLAQRLAAMEPAEVDARLLEYEALMTLYDNNLFQYESGFLDEDSWLAFRSRMLGVLGDPLNRQFYERMKQAYRPGFRVVVDTAIVEIESR